MFRQVNDSLPFDQAMAAQDMEGSIVWSRALAKTGVLTAEEQQQLESALSELKAQAEAGEIDFGASGEEDIHSFVEAALIEKLGDVGRKLHTGRSRNDQVATDIRLWLRDELLILEEQYLHLMVGLLDLAEREAATIMPGFTHLQTAQPVTFGHHLLAWFEMLKRDRERLLDCRKRVNRMPLGAAALAGTTYPINRERTCELLGFDGVCENSLDAVSDRDFAIEFCALAALTMTHLSRISEELVLWTSAQFNFINLPDRFCTGSSIMPQKKNPDVPELVRGKTGRVNGHLISLLTLMKSQPLAYNKDNQEDKEPLYDAVDTLKGSLRAFGDMIPSLEPNREVMREAARRGFATATDLADYLVRKGIAFRDSHEIVGKAVAYGVEKKKDLGDMTLSELKQFSDQIDDDVFDVLTLEGSVSARNHIGGTAPDQVRAAVGRAREALDNTGQ
jgi:argininosuccinate lyase